jgi:hypothetical protein
MLDKVPQINTDERLSDKEWLKAIKLSQQDD